ncbi:MAG TPA: hypothetical protein VG347_03920 [Verrucomicrobiae bacterium]|nr:hypothetical protein [Verrucomicrobiae bacterium]
MALLSDRLHGDIPTIPELSATWRSLTDGPHPPADHAVNLKSYIVNVMLLSL